MRNEIDKYKLKKTFIYFEFIEYSEKNVSFEKIKVVDQEFIIDKNTIFFEYNDYKYPYNSEITEEIILTKNGFEQKFLITIKKQSNNFYKIFNNNSINEKT